MSAVELKELMVHVERIVRPVVATESRKLQMRRELLGHLQAALAEEREMGADDAIAWEAAKKRLGDPDALMADLQRSVPVMDSRCRRQVQVTGWRRPGKVTLQQRPTRA